MSKLPLGNHTGGPAMIGHKEPPHAPDNTPRFPLALVVAAVVTMLCLMIWSRFDERNADSRYQLNASHTERLATASARILHLDEVLTMSARMAAATGDKAWIVRYNRYAPELDRLIKEMGALAASKEAKGKLVETDKSNQMLVRMETESFRLVLVGRRNEAQSLLSGTEYLRQKSILSDGIKACMRTINGEDRKRVRLQHDKSHRRFLMRIALNCLVLVLWFLALRKIALVWRRKAEEVQESEEKFRTIYESTCDAVMLLDEKGFFDCNSRTLDMFGFDSKEEFMVIHPADASPPTQPDGQDSFLAAQARIETAMRDGSNRFDWIHRRRNGEDFPAEVLLSVFELGGRKVLQATVRDIAERVKLTAELASEREHLATTLKSIGDGVIAVDVNKRVTLINSVGEALTGWHSEAAVGMPFAEVFNAVDEFSRERIDSPVDAVIRTGAPMELANHVMLISRDGSEFSIADSCAPIRDGNGTLTGVVLVFRDVTEQKKAEEALARANIELEKSLINAHELTVLAEQAREDAEGRAVELDYKSTHDALTGLANRREFERQIGERIKSGSSRRSSFAILFMDLDKFKLVNDSLGHEIGDLLLIECGKRLRYCIRSTDVIARMGGDEFTAIISAGRNLRESCDKSIDRVLDYLSRPYDVGGHRLTLGVSIGIAQYPGDGADVQALMKHADAAMYSAKQSGRGMARWYSGEMEADSSIRLSAENDLSHAVENDELQVFYQPIMDLQDGGVHGFEALLRWEHPTKGMISPGLFIPLAEETGLIHSIGDYVLRTACAQMRTWLDEGIGLLHCAVNVSMIQLRHELWEESVAAALRDTGLDASFLVAELTESDICQVKDFSACTSALSEMGVQLAIDDFGVGQSSLSRLREIQGTHIKLDGTFLRNELAVESQAKLLRSVIELIHEQDARVTAEWVETEQQNTFLREMGCDYAQGYYHSRPVTADQFREFTIAHARTAHRKVA